MPHGDVCRCTGGRPPVPILCHMEMCASAQEGGLQFPGGFAEDYDKVIIAFSSVEASMEQVNKERAKAAANTSKKKQ